ncbi:Hypothetical protein R9X50_00240700 [Acrodontium crateriforme]|uniref:Zn(2)-C6 fungal-type domain-containing protein n=1 Tax=Acrodontium crateriforme TaxID=150365 RepID=A0AAQ3M134_9PEZI|nr:Hypothetical protein R9X50_00240700 [Acrodontium crateriforme]
MSQRLASAPTHDAQHHLQPPLMLDSSPRTAQHHHPHPHQHQHQYSHHPQHHPQQSYYPQQPQPLPPQSQPPPPPPPPNMHYVMPPQYHMAPQHPQTQAPLPHAYAPLPPQYHHPASYPPNGAVHPAMHQTMTANGNTIRYAIPQVPLHPAHGAAGRHARKEVKRRTKTGCLTCRKRRIKCDETAPHCRNCQKSKRDCFYDTGFKLQQPGPAAIQPAPQASIAHSIPSCMPVSVPVTVPANQYPLDQQYPHPPPPAFLPSTPSAPATSTFAPSLDPALAGATQSEAMAQNNTSHILQPQRLVQPVHIDQLFALNDIPPPYQKHETPLPPSPALQHEIVNFVRFHYAQGLDVLFETTWYTNQILIHLQQDVQLQDFVAQCISLFKVGAEDASASRALPSIEARLVWQLAQIPRSAAERSTVRDPQLQELLPRLDTLEQLITGQFIETTSVPPPPHPGPPSPIQDSQTFWHRLGRFVLARDDRADSLDEVNHALIGLRQMLGKTETRDVLYSIAVARHVGGRMPSFHPNRQITSTSNDPNDPVNQLNVAHHFIEAEHDRATNQVIKSICGMSLRSWALAKQ